ncbi:trihelix transcription factor GT-1-like isoform X2 [Salvia hispanica]|uniref:trihelix transcription factor GT-1-like isoform X2 n=1 Tax=Salvia hispanica TaxID=49212 RepID=UPI002009CC38|nr:trihelix transcription factor GT-1-like isoform X2 [Salvia hispanica]
MITANQSSFKPLLPPPAPRKRAEAWGEEETRALVSLRRDTDFMFSASEFNQHLWDYIHATMRERGFDRSAAMCAGKWRNLLRQYRGVKQNINPDADGSDKMNFYREIDDIVTERGGNWMDSELDSFVQSVGEKDVDDASLTLGHMEGSGGSALNSETHMDLEAPPLSIITEADAVNVSPWNWSDTLPGKGEQRNTYRGRVITVKMEEYTKRIGIDGSGDAIKEAIKSAFGLRTKRAFWLEDEDNIVRALGREMPMGNYILHIDEGLMIRVCSPEHLPVHTEEKTFYTDDDFRQFLSRRFWACLRENNGYRHIDSMDELCPGAVYRGVPSTENILL